MSDSQDNVKVAVRIRPLIKHEVERREKAVVKKGPHPATEVGIGDKLFTFDYVFHLDQTQDTVYKTCITPLANAACQGYNVTIFAYGQTGSGKTYSMGTERASLGHRDEKTMGIVPRFANDLFRYVQQLPENQSMTFTVTFMELYNEQLVDLLDNSPIERDPATGALKNRDRLHIKEDAKGVHVDGLEHKPVTSPDEVMQLMDQGVAMRVTASTHMNSTSSRSHAIFTLHMHKTITTVLDDAVDGETEVHESTYSKIHFVDLAGSERLAKTGAEGKQMKEGISINLGLLALGNVINTLADEKKRKAAEASGAQLFVPYRDSKLTRILQDSLGGNSKTLMLACASPAEFNSEETLSTLRYADRARQIKNKAVVNRDAISEQIHNLKQQIKQLQVELVMEHFSVTGISHNDVMGNAEYRTYIDSKMEMRVEIDDDNMPSVFSEYANNALGAPVPTRKGKGMDGPMPQLTAEMFSKAKIEEALAQLNAAEERMTTQAKQGGGASAVAGGGGGTAAPSATATPRQSSGVGSRPAASGSARGTASGASGVDNAVASAAAVKQISLDAVKTTLEQYAELQLKLKSMSVQQGRMNEERNSLLNNMTHMAGVFDRRGDYEFALEMYQRALAMKETSLGSNHPSTAATLWSMAEVCGNRRDYNNALHLFQRALSILEETFGHEHKDVAIVLNNIALVHSHNGNDDHALFVYNKALQLKIKLLGADNLSVADTRVKMAKVYAKLQQHEEALSMLNQALQIQMKVKGQDAYVTADTLEQMAAIAFKQSSMDAAINLYTRALNVLEATHGQGHACTLDILRKLSTAYEVQKDYAKAHVLLTKLLDVQEKTAQAKASTEANAMLSRAAASGNQAAQKHAMEMYQRAIVEQREETASILGRLGAAAAQFDKKKAIDAYQKALKIPENVNKVHHQRALDALQGK